MELMSVRVRRVTHRFFRSGSELTYPFLLLFWFFLFLLFFTYTGLADNLAWVDS